MGNHTEQHTCMAVNKRMRFQTNKIETEAYSGETRKVEGKVTHGQSISFLWRKGGGQLAG